jgi:hypothetical protein
VSTATPRPLGTAADDTRSSAETVRQGEGGVRPGQRLNPGVLVDPQPVDADLRATGLVGRTSHFAEAVHRCSGVGKCLADTTAGLGVMCPS